MSFGEAPAAVANTPVMRSVKLKHHLDEGDKQLQVGLVVGAHFRPQTSQPIPQNADPMTMPMFCASFRKGPRKFNSFTTGVNMRPETFCAKLEYVKSVDSVAR